jgi:hypothetical protein
MNQSKFVERKNDTGLIISKLMIKCAGRNTLIKIASILFAAVIISFLGGCAPGLQHQFVSPEYKNREEFNVSVLVIPYKIKCETPALINENGTQKNKEAKPVTRQEIEIFDRYITPLLSENTWAKLMEPGKDLKPENLKLAFKEVDTELKEKKILLLPDSKSFVYNGIIPDYILLFQNLYFVKNFDEKMVGLGNGTNSIYTIECGLEYLLWDNLRGKIAAYGNINKNLPLLSAPTKEEYLFLFETFASRIIKESPLAAKKIFY